MAAGGGAEQSDPLGIDLELAGAAADELHRRQHVVDGMREHLLALLGQPIADREQGIAARGEIGTPELERAARARLPAATMHADQRWERPRPRRQVEVARERDA